MDENNTTEEQKATIMKGENAPAETVKVELGAKPKKIDIIAIFQVVDKMRTEGVPEEDIRAAFAEFMDENSGKQRRPQVTQRKSETMIPMPTQEEINDLYDKRIVGLNEDGTPKMDKFYKGVVDKDIQDEKLQRLLEEIELVLTNNALRDAPKISKLKIYAYRAAYFTVGKVLSAAIWLLRKCGAK